MTFIMFLKVSAEGVKPLARGSIPLTPVKEEMLYGKVVRPLRSVNPDQVIISFFVLLFILPSRFLKLVSLLLIEKVTTLFEV